MPGDSSNSSSGKTLKEIAQDKLNNGNASQLGDPVSMKAETADSHPTEQDRGAKGVVPERKTTAGTKTGNGNGEGSGQESGSGGGNGGAIDNDKVKGKSSGNVSWDKIEGAGREGANEEGKPPAGGKGGQGKGGKKTLAESYQESNKSMLGDPVSLKAEGAKSEPTEQDRGAMSAEERRKRGSKL